MYQKDFIPVAFRVKFKSEDPLPVEKWQTLIEELLENYAHQIAKKDDCIIGHIKALAEINEFSYLKFSCVNVLAGVNSEFHGNDQYVDKINMVVNSLVMNLAMIESRNLLNQSWIFVLKQEGSIRMQIEEEALKPLAEHHHYEGNEDCPICKEQHHHHQ